MINNNKHYRFFISCPKGLEDVLAQEIAKFTKNEVTLARGGVSLKSPIEDAFKFLCHLRSASRVFLYVAHTHFQTEKDIYKGFSSFPWQDFISPEQTFKINTIVDFGTRQKFSNSVVLSQILKDSIVDKIRKHKSKRPSIELRNPDITILQRIEKVEKNKFASTLYLDIAGVSLDRRFYRDSGHAAPLRENLAAGLLLATDWNTEEPLIDIMCGTGTFLIEAALLKYNIAPSFLRLESFEEPFSFLEHIWFRDPEVLKSWEKIKKETIELSRTNIQKVSNSQIMGFDKDNLSLKLSRDHIRKWGISPRSIIIKKADSLKDRAPFPGPGVVVCNPPYGERLKEDDLKSFYHELGENLKRNYKGFRAYILVPTNELRKSISLKTSMRKEVFNGPLECRWIKYDLF